MSLMKIHRGSALLLLCACLTGLPAAAGASAPTDLPDSYNDEQQCAAGNAAACLSLGRRLLHAGATEPDLSLMLSYLSRACDLGAGAACPAADTLERLLDRDEPPDVLISNRLIAAIIEYQLQGGSLTDLIDGDDAALAMVMSHAWQSGDGPSCTSLGYWYYKGKGVGQDYISARRLYEQACSLDDGEGCYGLGAMYYDGSGVRADFARAAACFGRACDLGFGSGCRMLGVQYDVGVGVKRDQKRALEYYGRACDGGDQEGCDTYRRLLLRSQRNP